MSDEQNILDGVAAPAAQPVADSGVPVDAPVAVTPDAPVTDSTPAPSEPVVDATAAPAASVTDSTPAPVVAAADATPVPEPPVAVDAPPAPAPIVESPAAPSAPAEEVMEYKRIVNKVWVNVLEFPWLPDYVEVEFADGERTRVPSSQLKSLGFTLPNS